MNILELLHKLYEIVDCPIEISVCYDQKWKSLERSNAGTEKTGVIIRAEISKLVVGVHAKWIGVDLTEEQSHLLEQRILDCAKLLGKK